MDVSQINLFSMMKTSLAYVNERQALLSDNISNIDTPGYKAKDLKELDFKKLAMLESRRLQMRMTSPMHMSGPHVDYGNFRHIEQDPTYETTPVENNIVLEEQMGKVAVNNLENQKVSNMYRKWADMLRMTLGPQ